MQDPLAPPPTQQDALGAALRSLLESTQQGQAPGQSVSASVPAPRQPNPALERSKQRVETATDRLAGTAIDPRALASDAGEEVRSISNNYRSAIAQPLSEIHAITDEQLVPLRQEAEAADAEYNDAVKERAATRARTQSAIDDMDRLGKSIAAEQPRDIWADANLGTKIFGIALQGLGGAAQALYGDKTNSVTDAIDAAIKKDLALQRMRIDKREGDYANKNLLLNQLRGNMDRTEHAEDAAHATAWQGILGRLQVVKSMLTDPTMRANAEKVIAEGEMKAAQSTQKLMTNLVGLDVRQKQAVGQLEVQAAKLNADAGGAAMLNAQTRAASERRLQGKDAREQTALEIPNWEAVDGKVMGSPKEVTELREGEASAQKASQSMEQVISLLQQGGQYTSYPKWQDIEAAVNRSIVKLKGKGMHNMGANFSEMERQLEAGGFLGADKSWKRNLDPKAAQRIQDALRDMWEDVRSSMAERNYKPAKTHPVFGE